MTSLICCVLISLFAVGCTNITVYTDGDVTIDAHKQISTDADAGLNGL